jgi:hypothetical protein
LYTEIDREQIISRPRTAGALIRFNADRLDLVQVDRTIKFRFDNLAFERENGIKTPSFVLLRQIDSKGVLALCIGRRKENEQRSVENPHVQILD